MLLWTLCVDEGLMNEKCLQSFRTMRVQDPFSTIPAMLLVEINDYAGRAAISTDERNVVPILLRTQQWDHNGSTCSRTQIPLTLAFAITIHKS